MTSFALPSSLQTYPISLLTGPDGNLWVVEPGKVATMTPEGVVTIMNVGSTPTDYFESPVFGSDGNLWVSNGNNSNPDIDRITPEGVITGSRCRRRSRPCLVIWSTARTATSGP